MGKGWNASFHLGRRERLRQEVLHRVAGGPRPAPRDYTGHDGTHGSYYMKGWQSVDMPEILHHCRRYKEKYCVQKIQ